MTNSEIISILEQTGKLLELHDRDENRSKSYLGIIYGLERLEVQLGEISEEERLKIRGIGKLIAANIAEIEESGTLQELEELIAETPAGVLDLFKVKGIGTKKIKILWRDLGIDNLNALELACKSGTIAETKGFGEKTQTNILASLVFLKSQAGKLRMNLGHDLAKLISNDLKIHNPKIELVGDIPRNLETVTKIQVLWPSDTQEFAHFNLDNFSQNIKNSSPYIWRGTYAGQNVEVEIILCKENEVNQQRFLTNSGPGHLQYKNEGGIPLYQFAISNSFSNEEELYSNFGTAYIVPEMREGLNEFEWSKKYKPNHLIEHKDLKGCVHNHSTYSDGKYTLKEMADYAKNLGLDYFGIADHSQTATYAKGLEPHRVIKQQEEIDELNAAYGNEFKILKGIESDILTDGSLDYEEDLLKTFDYVVASVHSVLNMDINKATSRLIKAIENPYTSILGHPTGRLLLSRDGYPLDFKKIIDACAANNVIMELNASPYRLDIDWRYINYCMEKGVLISINPDAHHINGFHDMHYGTLVARKGGLTKDFTFNAFNLEKALKQLKK